MHDFNAGVGVNGLFWIVQIPDDAVTIDDDTDTVRISLNNVAVIDQLRFPNPGNLNLGNSGAPVTLSFNATYQKSGRARHVRPTSRDPLSPFNWAGEMSDATNSGNFSLAYKDGSFSAQGSFSSQGNFGEIGREKNGSFVRHEDQDEGDQGENEQAAAVRQSPGQASASVASGQLSTSATLPSTSPKWRGKVPVEYLVH